MAVAVGLNMEIGDQLSRLKARRTSRLLHRGWCWGWASLFLQHLNELRTDDASLLACLVSPTMLGHQHLKVESGYLPHATMWLE